MTGLILFETPHVHAQGSASSAEEASRGHFTRGTTFYGRGRFDDAIREYEAGYLVRPDPVFLFNIAQCHRLAGRLGSAVHFYRAYLRRAPEAPNRAYVQGQIATLQRRLAAGEEGRPATQPPPFVPELDQSVPERDPGTRTAGLIVAGAGVAAFGAGVWFALDGDDGGDARLRQWSLLGVGAAAMLAGAALYWRSNGRDVGHERAGAAIVAPWLADGGVAGLAVSFATSGP